MIQGRIGSIRAVGALTHFNVHTPGQPDIHVTLAGSEAAQHGLQTGQSIALAPRQIYVFGQSELIDYAI